MARVPKYNTKQKQAILTFLESKSGQHVTVSDISEHFKHTGNSIATATVYRQLDQLVQAGFVKKYTLDAGSGSCFEFIGEDVLCDVSCFHFKCEGCGKLLHFHCHSMKQMQAHMLQHHGFAVDSIRTVFYGICDACKVNSKEENYE